MGCIWLIAALLPGLILKHYPGLLLAIATFFFIIIFCRMRPHCATPVNWPVVGMLPGLLANIHRVLHFVTEILEEGRCTFVFKGPWFVGMNFIVTCDPGNANHILSARFSNYPKGEDFLEIFNILGDGILNSDGHLWAVQRRMGVALTTDRKYRNSVETVAQEKVAEVLVPLLDRMAELDKEVDLQDVFMRFTFDTTCNLVLGLDPGWLAPDFPATPFALAVDDAQEVLFSRNVMPKVWWKLLRWLRVGEEKKMAMAWEVIDNYIAQCIAKKREEINIEKKPSTDLLTSYMHLSIEKDGKDNSNYIGSDKFLRDTALGLLTAGKDTIGAALSWFLWLVSTNPTVENKIVEELREVLPTKFDSEEIEKLVYLQAALFESLRLYPPVPFNHKNSMKPDVLPSGHRVQAGTMILISMYSMGRMETVWGEDCLEYKPERWITEKGELRHEPSHKFLAFNCGPRSCLGKNMALAQLKLVAAAVIDSFHFEVVEGHVVEPKIAIIMQMKNGFMVRVRRRIASG